MYVLGKSGENRAEVEEFVLHAQEDGGQQGQSRLLDGELVDGGARGSQKTVQFIHRTVRFNARAVFRDALAADESRFAAVALAGVDAIDGESGLVKGSFIATSQSSISSLRRS